MRPGRRLAPYSARRRSSTTPAPAASSRTAATANAIVEAPVLLRPLGSVASTLPFGLGLTAGFCGSGLVDGLLRAGLLAIDLHQSLPGGLQRGKRVSHLGGSRVLVGGDLLRSVEGGLELVRAGLAIRLGELAGLRDHLVQSRLVGGLDSHLEGLREVRALERHRHRDLAGRSERLRQINRLTG